MMNWFWLQKAVLEKILDNNNIDCEVIVSNVDEDEVKRLWLMKK